MLIKCIVRPALYDTLQSLFIDTNVNIRL